jgi:ParB family chromosome partitioning protein
MEKVKETVIEAPKGEIVYLPIEKLAPHPDNVRKNVGDVSELAASIAANGVLQNLTVVPSDIPDDGGAEYLVVIGNRRLEAAKAAGLSELPCVIAEMTREEQIKTMLLENIQRSNLTPLEQADGFQLLLDFGGTLSSIAAVTGFSESTVRRRVRLKEIAKASGQNFEGRQISFDDLDKLYKIEDEKKRAKVAESLGTKNFEWELKSAIDGEKKKKNIARWTTHLEGSALTKLDKVDGKVWEWYRMISLSEPCKRLADELCGEPESEFGYAASDLKNGYGVYIKRRIREKKPEQMTPEQKAAREKTLEVERKKKLLKEAETRAFELRRDFVRGVSEQTAKEHLCEIVTFLAQIAVWSIDDGVNERLFFDVLGMKRPEDDGEEYVGAADIEGAKVAAEARPAKTLLALAYAKFDGAYKGASDWRGAFEEDETSEERLEFQALCDLLDALGYEASDGEIALRDGTSELYVKEEEV